MPSRSPSRYARATQYAAASIVLGLMFVALIVIYLNVPQSDVVTFLAVLIMAVSLIIALNGGWNEIGIMAGFAGVVSLIATYFLGRNVLGNVGSIVLPLAWGALLVWSLRLISSRTVIVPEDNAIMVARFYSGDLYRLTPPIAPPLIPLLERRVATIPLYELSQDVHVAKINTSGGQSIDTVEVHIRYCVFDPSQALVNIPNRGQIQNDVARDMGRDLDRARLDVAFWEKLLARQLGSDVDDIVREVVFREARNAVEAYTKRREISTDVVHQLNELVRRWGVRVTSVDIDHFDVADERFRSANMLQVIERETQLKEIEAQREATHIKVTGVAEAEAEADRVKRLVRALKEEGVEITPEVIAAMLMPDLGLDEPLPTAAASTAARPPAGKPDNAQRR